MFGEAAGGATAIALGIVERGVDSVDELAQREIAFALEIAIADRYRYRERTVAGRRRFAQYFEQVGDIWPGIGTGGGAADDDGEFIAAQPRRGTIAIAKPRQPL